MVTCTQSQYESNILTSRGFQKGITCLGSVHFQIWPLMTSHDLKWPRILKISTDSFLAWSQLSKNIRFIKSQKFHFSGLFSSTSSVGWNGPKPKFKKTKKTLSLTITPTSILIPQSSYLILHTSILNPLTSILNPQSSILVFWFLGSSYLNPKSSILNPRFLFSGVRNLLYALLLSSWAGIATHPVHRQG